MVKALLWKEWRRLRALRWSLVGIGLALPVLFALAAKAAEKGWGMAAFTGYSLRSILLEAVPAALGLGLWPLAAMVLAVQAFTADRADGTEAFLLDRPVSRRWIWTSRLLASLGSLGVVVLLGLGMVYAFVASYGQAGFSSRVVLVSATGSAVLMLAATLAALGATAVVPAPLAAFLVALLLAATPLLAGAGGAVIFPYARWEDIPLAGLAACFLGVAMPLASWIGDTKGEPAGRGRRVRSSAVLGGGLVLAALGFAIVAPFAVRAGAPRARLSVVPPLEGGTTLVTGERGYVVPRGTAAARGAPRVPSSLANGPAGFLVDLTTGKRGAFLPPEVQWAGWNPSGTKLVIMDNAGPLGSVGASRLRFLDAGGRTVWPSVPEPEGLTVQQVVWAGDRLAVVYGGLGTTITRVDVLDPSSGRQATVFESAHAPFATLHAARDGRVFVHTVESESKASGPVTRLDPEHAVWSLRPLDAQRSRLGSPVLEGRGILNASLSPSGRFWLERSRGSSQIVDLASGAASPVPVQTRPSWMPWMGDDSLVWLEGDASGWTLFRMAPGASPLPWAKGPGRFPVLKVSPDGSFAAVIPFDPQDEQRVLLADVAVPGSTHALPRLVPFRFDTIEWAGPQTLAVTSRGRLDLYDVTTGKRTVVFGRP